MSFFFFRGTFFQCDINLLINYNKIIKRRLFFLRHLLGQPARADGRDPAKITGRFRANFRLAMCTFNSKLICSAGVQTFFSQGGAPRQRSEIPHRMIPIPPKVGGSSLGYAYFLHISPLFINTMLLALVIYIQFTGKNRPCGAWTMSQLNCPLVYFYSHSLS